MGGGRGPHRVKGPELPQGLLSKRGQLPVPKHRKGITELPIPDLVEAASQRPRRRGPQRILGFLNMGAVTEPGKLFCHPDHQGCYPPGPPLPKGQSCHNGSNLCLIVGGEDGGRRGDTAEDTNGEDEEAHPGLLVIRGGDHPLQDSQEGLGDLVSHRCRDRGHSGNVEGEEGVKEIKGKGGGWVSL